MKKKTKILIISILIVTIILGAILIFYPRNTLTIIQLSNQGSRQMMGYLLKTENGKLIAIDGGTTDDTENLVNKINENGGKVDYWFLTHAHDDHVGAFTEVISNTDIEVGKIYVSVNDIEWYEQNEPSRIEFTTNFLNILKSEKIKNNVIEPAINEKIFIDNIEIEILGIKNPEIIENAGNEQSMVFSINTGKTKILILGDTGIQSSEKLLNNQKEKLKSDIVQMSHHGQNGATKQLYEQIEPTICMWPTPQWLWDNDAGEGYNTGTWKTVETRQWMEELHVKKHYVEKDGDLTIKIR